MTWRWRRALLDLRPKYRLRKIGGPGRHWCDSTHPKHPSYEYLQLIPKSLQRQTIHHKRNIFAGGLVSESVSGTLVSVSATTQRHLVIVKAWDKNERFQQFTSKKSMHTTCKSAMKSCHNSWGPCILSYNEEHWHADAGLLYFIATTAQFDRSNSTDLVKLEEKIVVTNTNKPMKAKCQVLEERGVIKQKIHWWCMHGLLVYYIWSYMGWIFWLPDA
jgi:hypothetical protein